MIRFEYFWGENKSDNDVCFFAILKIFIGGNIVADDNSKACSDWISGNLENPRSSVLANQITFCKPLCKAHQRRVLLLETLSKTFATSSQITYRLAEVQYQLEKVSHNLAAAPFA